MTPEGRSIPQWLLRSVYRGMRRGGVIDVTRLMYRGAIEDASSAGLPESHRPGDYRIESLDRQQLGEAIASHDAPATIGLADQLDTGSRAVIVVRDDHPSSTIVAHLWLCRDHVDATDNFSRSEHLGTSLSLPPGCLFVYHAWTAPTHRGRGLVAAMLSTALAMRVLDGRELLTTVDWTNEASRRAFTKFGLRDCGLIWRCGRGRWQCSLLPPFGRELGLQLAESAPGVKWIMPGAAAP